MCVLYFYYFDLQKGDPTLSVLELWGAEYQESNALLLRPSDRDFLERVCRREKCPVDFVGNITGDGKAGFSLSTVHSLQNLTVTHIKSQFFYLHRLCWLMMKRIALVSQTGGAVLLTFSWNGSWERCHRRSLRWSVWQLSFSLWCFLLG